MKKGKLFGIFALIAAAGAASVAAVKVTRRLKEKKLIEEYNDENDDSFDYYEESDGNNPNEDYHVEDPASLEFAIFAFDNANDMHKARLSKKFWVDSYYELEDKAYLVIFLENNQQEIEEYGGVMLTEDEMNDFYLKTLVDTMYFYFETKECAKRFISAIEFAFDEKTKIPMAYYQDCLYMDLSRLDKRFEKQIKHLAPEFYGEQITDLFIANQIKPLFELVN